jgi:transposase InsO family protein
MSDVHDITLLCVTLEVSRSGYYEWQQREQAAPKDAALRLSVIEIHRSSLGTYGSPRIHRELRKRGQRISRKRVARVMRDTGIVVRAQRRYRVQTTDSRHPYPIAENLLLEQPQPTKPNEVWVSDITYVATGEGWLYVAGVMDLATRRICGWAAAETLHTSLVESALVKAIQQSKTTQGIIHHSDRGCQYASAQYVATLRRHGLRSSMSRRANCYDNAHMESFWSTLKLELIYRTSFPTRAAAKMAIFKYIEGFYNPKRLHSALGFKSPLDYEKSLN